MVRAKRNRFLLNVFVVRHTVGIGMLAYIVYESFRLAPKIALGSLAALALYLGFVIWMGVRLYNDIRRQEGR